MAEQELVPYEVVDAVVIDEVDIDVTLIEMWLHGTPESTKRAYRREIRNLLDYTGKHLHDITIFDMQAYETDTLMELADASRARAIAAIKSLYKRIRQAGLITVNPAELLRSPKLKETQAERYLTPEQVDAIVAQAKTERDHAMLTLMYQTGMRISEIVSLTWKDIVPTSTGATLTVYGKGGKTRYVDIDPEMLSELNALPHTAECVFPSSKTGKCMSTTQGQRIVVDAALKAGIDASPHFFRHAHISHLIEAGVPLPEIRDEVGHANIVTTNKYAHSTGGKPLGSVLRRK